MKIIHIGHNFLSSEDKTQFNFTVYSKPDSSLLKDGKPFFIPDFAKKIEYQLNIVYRINRLGKNISERFAHRYYDAVTVGLSLVDIEKEKELLEAQAPLELSTGFDGSSIIGSFIKKENLDVESFDIRLDVDSHIQRLSVRDMKASIDYIIAFISKYYTLKIGDLIFVGESADAVGNLEIGQNFKGYLDGNNVLSLKVC